MSAQPTNPALWSGFRDMQNVENNKNKGPRWIRQRTVQGDMPKNDQQLTRSNNSNSSLASLDEPRILAAEADFKMSMADKQKQQPKNANIFGELKAYIQKQLSNN
jgi:hypothetical protein